MLATIPHRPLRISALVAAWHAELSPPASVDQLAEHLYLSSEIRSYSVGRDLELLLREQSNERMLNVSPASGVSSLPLRLAASL